MKSVFEGFPGRRKPELLTATWLCAWTGIPIRLRPWRWVRRRALCRSLVRS